MRSAVKASLLLCMGIPSHSLSSSHRFLSYELATRARAVDLAGSRAALFASGICQLHLFDRLKCCSRKSDLLSC